MHFFDRKYVCVECVVSRIHFVPSVLFFVQTETSRLEERSSSDLSCINTEIDDVGDLLDCINSFAFILIDDDLMRQDSGLRFSHHLSQFMHGEVDSLNKL